VDQLKNQEEVWHGWRQTDKELPQGDVSDLQGDMDTCLTADRLRNAARSFKKGTAQIDGWKPCHIGELTDGTLALLGRLLQVAEAVGQYPKAGQYVMTTLIPKPDGGLRPINLFPAVFRLHSRCRSGILKAWARGPGRHVAINMAHGRHTNDGIYRILVRHGLRTVQGPSAAVLWDTKQAFENVRRDELVKAAVKFGYPLRWLRLSLASYQWPRILIMEHAAGRTVRAQVGIGAGAMSATYELHLYMLAMLHAYTQAFPSVGLTVHVDDIIRDFQGPTPHDVVCQVKASSQLMKKHLASLGLPLAKDKEQIVGTTEALATAVSKASLGRGSTAEASVRRLGCDFSLDQNTGRARTVHKQRIAKTRKRLTRMASKFRKVNTKLLFHAGVMPAATFGVDIHGMPPKSLRILMQGARRQCAHTPIAVPTSMALYAWRTDTRPDFMAIAAPILRYAREVWTAIGPGQ
jgi:hypothetical protein